jgi:hypothetical protein
LIAGQLMVVVFSISLYFGNVPWVFGLGYFMLGGYRLSRSMLIAKIRSTIRDYEVGLAFGILETVSGVAIILTPLLAGLLYEKNPHLVYLLSIPLIFLLAVVSFLVFRKSTLNPQDQEETA